MTDFDNLLLQPEDSWTWQYWYHNYALLKNEILKLRKNSILKMQVSFHSATDCHGNVQEVPIQSVFTMQQK